MSNTKINPFYFTVFFYLLVNFIYTIIGFQTGSMVLEFQFKPIDRFSFIYAFLFQCISILLIIICYYFSSQFLNNKSKFEISNKVAMLVLIGQILYLIVNVIYGANKAGDAELFKGPAFLNMFFILLPFDLLFLILGVSFKSSKFFYLNAFIYLASSLMRGWMGGVFLLLFTFICRSSGFNFNLKAIIKYFIAFIVIMLMAPYLIEMKWIIRSDKDIFDLIENVNDRGYISELGVAVDYMFNRFQHVGHVALIFDNSDFLSGQYLNGKMVPYWGEGIIQSVFMNVAHIDSFTTFPRFVTVSLFHVSPDASWTTNVGMAGWFFILGYRVIFYITYVFFLLVLPFTLVAKFANKQTLLLLSVFSIFYLFHGWFYAYFTMVVYVLMVVFVKRLKI